MSLMVESEVRQCLMGIEIDMNNYSNKGNADRENGSVDCTLSLNVKTPGCISSHT